MIVVNREVVGEAEAHYNPRAQIMPPDDLISTIWPCIELKEMLLKQHPECLERLAALEIIHAMKYLRIVLLQDAAWFYTRGRGKHAFFYSLCSWHQILSPEQVYLTLQYPDFKKTLTMIQCRSW
jgi:hypothetical protein